MNKNNCLTFALCMVVSSVAFAGKKYNLTLQRKFARQEKAENQNNPESPFGKAEPKTVTEAREFQALIAFYGENIVLPSFALKTMDEKNETSANR